MRGFLIFIVIMVAVMVLAGKFLLGSNYAAKHFGGTATVNLPAHQHLVNVTWKDEHLWYLTRPMRDDESAEDITFQEQSNFGIIQGKVIFHETK